MVVAAMQQPHFVRHAGGVRTKRIVVALYIDDARPLLLFLPNDVAENTALLFLEPLASCAQFVLDTTGHEYRARDFRMGVRPFLASQFALILKYAHVFKP